MTAMLERLRRMTGDELRFRTSQAVRKWNGRARTAVRSPRWNRDNLVRILAATPAETAALEEARAAAARRNWSAAHRALAAHFATRASAFPLDSRHVASRASAILARFPDAAADARRRADAIVEGRYDLLGYTDLQFGHPPDWEFDPVHRRRSPRAFWSSIDYLDPRHGDHKIIWELNRHQHWLTLGRAFALTHDVRYYREFVAQIDDWMARNPPLVGTNWASMLELAFRSLSWLWSISFFSAAAHENRDEEAPWLVDLLVGVDRQLGHIRHNLSLYFSPNTHLTGEALALYVLGESLPELSGSASRARLGKTVLLGEIDRQIAPDGGHAERSAHYHRYSTDFFLLALSVARGRGDDEAHRFEDAARRQATFLRTIADDGGRLPQLGDDDGGQLFPICRRSPADCSDSLGIAAVLLDDPALRVGPPTEEVVWLCGATALEQSRPEAPIAWPSRALPSSGYYVSRTSSSDHLLFDAGPHGFLNGGHAHSDALSVLLTIGGTPLLIDPGTGTYTMSPEARDAFRSTAMHNTVVLNGRPQSRPRGPFHWETSVDARAPLWRTSAGCDYVEGTHDWYAPLKHVRSVLAVHGVGWIVVDHVLGQGEAEAGAFWHLAPGWRVRRADDRRLELSHDNGESAFASTAAVHIIDDAQPRGLNSCSPIYGMTQTGLTLQTTFKSSVPMSFAAFVPATPLVAAGLALESNEVCGTGQPMWHGASFTVKWDGGSLAVLSSTDGNDESAGGRGPAGEPWGTRDLRTDGRLAAVLTRAHDVPEAILIDGTSILDVNGNPILRLPSHAPLIRARIAPELASTLHQLASMRAADPGRNQDHQA